MFAFDVLGNLNINMYQFNYILLNWTKLTKWLEKAFVHFAERESKIRVSIMIRSDCNVKIPANHKAICWFWTNEDSQGAELPFMTRKLTIVDYNGLGKCCTYIIGMNVSTVSWLFSFIYSGKRLSKSPVNSRIRLVLFSSRRVFAYEKMVLIIGPIKPLYLYLSKESFSGILSQFTLIIYSNLPCFI